MGDGHCGPSVRRLVLSSATIIALLAGSCVRGPTSDAVQPSIEILAAPASTVADSFLLDLVIHNCRPEHVADVAVSGPNTRNISTNMLHGELRDEDYYATMSVHVPYLSGTYTVEARVFEEYSPMPFTVEYKLIDTEDTAITIAPIIRAYPDLNIYGAGDAEMHEISESPSGALWYGGYNGLHVMIDPPGTLSKFSLDATYAVAQVAAAKSGQICVAAFSRNHSPTRYYLLPIANWTLAAPLLSDADINLRDMAYDAAGVLWVLSDTALMRCADGSLRTVAAPLHDAKSLVIDEGGRVWIAAGNGVIRYTESDTTLFDSTNTCFARSGCTSVKYDFSGRVWAYVSGGLYSYSGAGWSAYTIDSVPGSIIDYCVAPDSSVWLSTYVDSHGGLVCKIRDGHFLRSFQVENAARIHASRSNLISVSGKDLEIICESGLQ